MVFAFLFLLNRSADYILLSFISCTDACGGNIRLLSVLNLSYLTFIINKCLSTTIRFLMANFIYKRKYQLSMFLIYKDEIVKGKRLGETKNL